nr:early nodulin-like protein 1 [Tanacetum cinerariifolium]
MAVHGLLFAIMFFVLMQANVFAYQYQVGNLQSWNVPTSEDPKVYANWPKKLTFRIGDSLFDDDDGDGPDGIPPNTVGYEGYGTTNSLLEQWSDSYPDNDDFDPYDDDMYENHDMSEHLQSICDDLDITVRGRKKK